MNSPLFTHFRQAEILAVLAHRNFRYIFVAQVVSGVGDAIYWVALPWLVLQEMGTATAVGITSAAAVIPFIILSPLAGVLADRVDRKLLMIVSHVARVAVLAALIIAGRMTSLDTLHFAVAGFFLTAAGLLFYPARVAILPNLLPRERLVAGNAALAAGMQATRIGGTAAAGFLFATIGGLNALGGVLVAYGIAAMLIGRIKAPAQTGIRSTVSTGGKPHVRLASMLRDTKSDLVLSVSYILKHPLIRAMAVAGVVLNAFHYPAMGLLLPVYFRQALEAGPESFGLFSAIESAAILVALPAAPWLARPRRRQAQLTRACRHGHSGSGVSDYGAALARVCRRCPNGFPDCRCAADAEPRASGDARSHARESGGKSRSDQRRVHAFHRAVGWFFDRCDGG